MLTLDNWKDIARANMYGCDRIYYLPSNGAPAFDALCVDPVASGYYSSLYFGVFIIIGTMVLINLFVGVIITSMELLKASVKEEASVWVKVKATQKQFHISDSTVGVLLNVFELLDVAGKGKLTVSILQS